MRYVVALAEERNFTRAAQRCHVVQSALSHQIKALEHELGVTLFARTSRRVELTTAGEAFLSSARATLDAAERAVADASAATGQVRGTLTIGVIPTVTAIDIPSALGQFHQQHPEVRIRLRNGNSNEFISAISGGTMDVAVLGLPDSAPPQGINANILARERLVAVVPADHALASEHSVRLHQLVGEKFVDFPEGTPGRVPSDLAFHSAGIQREVAFEAMSTDLILGLVSSGLVIALLSPSVIPVDDTLRAVPVADGPTRIEYLAWSSFNPTAAAQAFIDGLPTSPTETTGPAAPETT
ncbi:LysR substrate-binding domain-containing protein [Nesterenkonia haasae]|uniref:LysR substrate-binding domain-containing protein n=1 Tax=Nesterenkonia haasae TaxID=2587813 RepID=UPI00192EFC1A|nr:LysR substrate-binding domain-containing protein [Nesterenkonia haasae]